METKHYPASDVKVTDTGEVTAQIAQFNVIDHDGDVTLPGAFTEGQPVRMSAYNHSSWGGALPVGKGTIHTDGDAAIFEGSFFMKTTAGRDTFEVVKELGELGQWSYGFDVIEASHGEQEGRVVQFLKQLDVTEVSPVLRGAGIETRTLSVKSADELFGKGMTDEEYAEQVECACQALLKRGLAYPPSLVAAVKQRISEEVETNRYMGELHLIAALNGIDTTTQAGGS